MKKYILKLFDWKPVGAIKLIFPEVRSLRTFYRWRSGNYSVDGREIQKMEMEMTKLVDGYKELKKQIF